MAVLEVSSNGAWVQEQLPSTHCSSLSCFSMDRAASRSAHATSRAADVDTGEAAPPLLT